MQIRSIQRTIEFDFGFLKLESKALRNDIDVYIKRKNETEYYYIKNIHNSLNEIMSCETLLQEFLIQHALGNKMTETLQISLAGLDYDIFTFSKVYNGSVISVEYALGSPSIMKSKLFYANYYDLNQLLYISNNLMGNYMKQQENLKKEKADLIEKFKKKK